MIANAAFLPRHLLPAPGAGEAAALLAAAPATGATDDEDGLADE
jgi:hypothetical protein